MAKEDIKKNQAVADETTQDAQPGFGIEKLYVKDASIEVPNAPQIFMSECLRIAPASPSASLFVIFACFG